MTPSKISLICHLKGSAFRSNSSLVGGNGQQRTGVLLLSYGYRSSNLNGVP